MDKLDKDILEKDVLYTLKKGNKKSKPLVSSSKKEEKPIIKSNSNFKFDGISNISNGSNPKKFFEIKNFLSPNLFDIYFFIGEVPSNIKLLIDKIKGNFDNLSKLEQKKVIDNFSKEDIDSFDKKLKKKKLGKGIILKKCLKKKMKLVGKLNLFMI